MKSKPMPAFSAGDIDRFWTFVQFDEECWTWTGVTKDGYGRFRIGDRMVSAHRFAYVLANGEPDPDHDVDHLCRNHPCVRGLHLEAVTHQENVLRGEGLAAQWAARTTCAEGHLFDRVGSRGERACSICLRDKGRERQRAWRQRQKVAA